MVLGTGQSLPRSLMMDHQPLYAVTGFWAHVVTKESDISVMCNGKSLHVTLSADNFRDAPAIKEQYLQYLEAIDADSFDVM
jgi:hypothetical protein